MFNARNNTAQAKEATGMYVDPEGKIAATAGYKRCTDDPAWQEACNIDQNERETFRGDNPDVVPEERDTYPRPLATVLGAYDFGNWDRAYRLRLAQYLRNMGCTVPAQQHVRVGRGTKVHVGWEGSSTTACGTAGPRSGLTLVDAPVTCERCLHQYPTAGAPAEEQEPVVEAPSGWRPCTVLEMTPAQRGKVLALIRYWWRRDTHADLDDYDPSRYVVRDCKITVEKYGTVHLVFGASLRDERTYGHILYSPHSIFIGRRGGLTCYAEKHDGGKLRTTKGRDAIIYA